MNLVENKTLDMERALYGSDGIVLLGGDIVLGQQTFSMAEALEGLLRLFPPQLEGDDPVRAERIRQIPPEWLSDRGNS